MYTKECHEILESYLNVPRTLLATSCTDALEMASLLIDIKPGDEVIVPSFSFVSSALPFVRQGATVRFADSRNDHPGMDEHQISNLINSRTKAIVVVHYAGVACNMDQILEEARHGNIKVIEDAAQCIGAGYTTKSGKSHYLGTLGHLGGISFHETKNIHCGEGGVLIINDENYISRAEIIWEKGTNRSAFFRGQVDKYGWVDTGSSFLPSELNAAFLYAQLKNINVVLNQRNYIWNYYQKHLEDWATKNDIQLPVVPDYATHNSHIFFLIFPDAQSRTRFIAHMSNKGIQTTFHYQSLHNSKFYGQETRKMKLPMSEKYTDCLVRLPLYPDLSQENLQYVVDSVNAFKV